MNKHQIIAELVKLRNELGTVQTKLADLGSRASDLGNANASDNVGKAYGKVAMAWKPLCDAITSIELTIV